MEYMCKVALGWEHYQNKGPRMRQQPSLVLHFGNVPHPWALSIGQHKSKFIMNQTYIDHQVYEWEGSYAYCPIVGRFLHL
jgi:hypothetical protein